jgi:hypothetical protein
MLVFEPIETRWEGDFLKGRPVQAGRAKIPGGWLVAIQTGSLSWGIPPAHHYDVKVVLCFVPDPEHRWDGSSLPEAK